MSQNWRQYRTERDIKMCVEFINGAGERFRMMKRLLSVIVPVACA